MQNLYNPTDEIIETMYASRPFIFKPGQIRPIEDKATANHIVNEWGTRGIVALDYGDDTKKALGGGTVKEQKANAGIKANKAFRRKMIIEHNQMNEANKIQRLPYVHPTEKLIVYAKAEGIQLISPYEVSDETQKELNAQRAENRELNSMLREQGNQIKDLLEIVKAGGMQAPEMKSSTELDAEAKAKEIEAMVDKCNSYTRKDHFKTWLDQNLEAVKLWPEDAKSEVRKKHTDLVGGEQLKI